MAFACVYVLAHKADPQRQKCGKKEQKQYFDYSEIISIDYWWTTENLRNFILNI
jgi:hypothetical protein